MSDRPASRRRGRPEGGPVLPDGHGFGGVVLPTVLVIIFIVGFVTVSQWREIGAADDAVPAGHVIGRDHQPSRGADAAQGGEPRFVDLVPLEVSEGDTDAEDPAVAADPSNARGVVDDDEVQRKADLREKRLKAERKAFEKAQAQAPVTFRVGTFNILGSQHTGPNSGRPRWPAWGQRIGGAAQLVRKHQLTIVGMQEVQTNQLDWLTRNLGYRAYPGHELGAREAVNSILYDPAVWKRVDATTFTIPFMNGQRTQPILRLQHLATGREMYFINVHTTSGRSAANSSSRHAGFNGLVAVVNALKADGLPIFVTGDMNDRENFFCRVVPPTGMVAANGGSGAGGCTPPPRPVPVDWVVATPDVTFSGYWRDGTPQQRWISDHFIISAVATVAGG